MNSVTDWCIFWREFLNRERLNSVVEEMDELDSAHDNPHTIMSICETIYQQYYETEHDRWDGIRSDFVKELDDIAHIHLSTSRVKSIDSILRKIIVKRHAAMNSATDPYRTISAENYQDILTDLIGIRVILSYRGNWTDIHRHLLAKFPLQPKEEYAKGELLPHNAEKAIQAEWPKAYYAEGDDISAFQAQDIIPKLHQKGYRSIHYTISYQNTYIELQVRTIYDEAWSDVDHRYVYKQDANPSNAALKELSLFLCQLTNLSNDIGEQMKLIFDGEKMSRLSEQGKWLVTPSCKEFFAASVERLRESSRMLEEFYSDMMLADEDTE